MNTKTVTNTVSTTFSVAVLALFFLSMFDQLSPSSYVGSRLRRLTRALERNTVGRLKDRPNADDAVKSISVNKDVQKMARDAGFSISSVRTVR